MLGAGLTLAVPVGGGLWLCYICSSRDENKYYFQQNILLDVAHAVLNGKRNRVEPIPGIFLGRKSRFL